MTEKRPAWTIASRAKIMPASADFPNLIDQLHAIYLAGNAAADAAAWAAYFLAREGNVDLPEWVALHFDKLADERIWSNAKVRQMLFVMPIDPIAMQLLDGMLKGKKRGAQLNRGKRPRAAKALPTGLGRTQSYERLKDAAARNTIERLIMQSQLREANVDVPEDHKELTKAFSKLCNARARAKLSGRKR